MPAALILAAGKSERFGAPKVLQSFRGELFVARIVNALTRAGSEKIFLVLGHQAELYRARLSERISVTFVVNENYQFGQFSSVQAGVRAIGNDPGTSTLLCLIDQPHLQPETFSAIFQASLLNPQQIIFPTYQNRNGHPIYIPHWLFPNILAAPLTSNLRLILASHAEKVTLIPVPDAGILQDIDTPSDLERLEKMDLYSTF